MAKREKKEPDPPPGVPAWMATFSDLVTLLLTFFVMLMAMASFDDVTRVMALLRSLHERLGADGFDPGKLGSGEADAMNTAQDLAEISLSPKLAKLAVAFRMELSNEIVHTDQEENELRVDLPEGAFFRSGETTVHPGGYGLLAEVGEILSTEPGVSVHVVGFATPQEGSEPVMLATDRAVAVVERLRPTVDGERLSLSPYGRGGFDPKSGEEGWQRRIQLVLRADRVQATAPVKMLHEREESDGRR